MIHQTWKTAQLPDSASRSWQEMNPDWEWRLWTDADLLELVRLHYPDLEELFLSYPKMVQRTDLGRYLILDHCGGLYADLDTICLAPLEVLAGNPRVILAEEPVEHFHHARTFGLERMYFNGVMAGPAGHPFWAHLVATLRRCAFARDHVLESTGPLALTGAVLDFPAPETLALHSCHLFTQRTASGQKAAGPAHGPLAPMRLADHLWQGSWWTGGRERDRPPLRERLRKAKYRWTRGPFLSRAAVAARIDHELLRQPVTGGRNVSVLVPVRDAEPWLDRCMQLLRTLDYPAERLSLTFCEGDSRDRTLERLQDIARDHAHRFRAIRLTQLAGGPDLDRSRRWLPALQRARRSHLARVRNHLIDHGLTDGDDWALWLDADVIDYPPDILRRLLAERSKVVTPDCRLEPEGPSYDLNAFADPAEQRDKRYYKHVHRGLYMPPAEHTGRHHLHDMRFAHRVPLSSVGGTMLLVDASVHRAGLRFPELPYDDLLETEGFGRICRDFGVTPIGLPNVAILHAKG